MARTLVLVAAASLAPAIALAETVDDAGGRRPAPSTDELHRGRRAPGPLGTHEDVPVIDALTEQTGPDRT